MRVQKNWPKKVRVKKNTLAEKKEVMVIVKFPQDRIKKNRETFL